MKVNRISECWGVILRELRYSSQNLTTWSIYRPQRKTFTVRANTNSVIVEGPSISAPRTINYNEFECVARLYPAYAQHKLRIRQRMRNECGFNSSYIITLIHEFCEANTIIDR